MKAILSYIVPMVLGGVLGVIISRITNTPFMAHLWHTIMDLCHSVVYKFKSMIVARTDNHRAINSCVEGRKKPVSRWTHVCCTGCWKNEHVNRPVKAVAFRFLQHCCLCDAVIDIGVYINRNPSEILCQGIHKED